MTVVIATKARVCSGGILLWELWFCCCHMLDTYFFFFLDPEYFTLILLVNPAFSHESNRTTQLYREMLYLSDCVGNRGNCHRLRHMQDHVNTEGRGTYSTQNRAGMTLVPSLVDRTGAVPKLSGISSVFQRISSCLAAMSGT